ncbi:hypothetical protein [Egicoccus sp. AB-alg6-2]|uniref:hypothetical protein n=1 Tax=Egicoccus sp. AB-alg6-2 TaxID=3242692 RepID=UPI00359CD10E
MTPRRTVAVVQAELEAVRRHLHEAPPHHGSGTRAALEERQRRLERELASLRTAQGRRA